MLAHVEAEIQRQADHSLILFEHFAFEALQAALRGDRHQPLEQMAREALALPRVGDGDRELGGRAVLADEIACCADLDFGVAIEPFRDQCEVAAIVDMRRRVQHARIELANGVVKAEIA